MAKQLKIAGIFGIVLLVLVVISGILSFSTLLGVFSSIKSGGGIEALQQQAKGILNFVTIILLISYPISIGFLWGFVVLGKKFSNKMLSTTGWIFIVLAILGFILTLGFFATGNLYPKKQITSAGSSFVNILQQKASQTPVMGAILNLFGDAGFLPLLILLVASGLALKIIFGIGLRKLKKNELPLAGWAGSLEIGSIIVNGLGTIAMIMETIMFFQASKKFE